MDVPALARALLSGDRRALSRAITLAESSRADHRAAAADLMRRTADPDRRTLRIGLTGTPGVGKSTFVERFGLMLIAQGHRVAVLAVDPSSARTGGSILGDKTRMERLARDPAAFVRPTPSQTELGGVARRTREACALCEAGGHDVVVIETVGVGQSETAVAAMTDLFALLIAPGGGDALQGVKRGIMEAADLILVNKADGGREGPARRTAADYAGALRLMRRPADDAPGFPKALTVSAETGAGMDGAWEAMRTLHRHRVASGRWEATRAAQNRHWFDEALRRALLAGLDADPALAARREALGRAVAGGALPPGPAAEELAAEMLGRYAGGAAPE